jgi:hypothetical protein
VPDLPASSQVDHVMAGFPHSLIGLAPFVDMGCQVTFIKRLVIAFDVNDKAILIGWRETTGPRFWCWPLLPQHPTSPSLAGELRLLAPSAHDSQLDAINRLHNVINSVYYCPMTLPCSPCSCLCVLLSWSTWVIQALGMPRDYNTRLSSSTTPQHSW